MNVPCDRHQQPRTARNVTPGHRKELVPSDDSDRAEHDDPTIAAVRFTLRFAVRR
jgi:hypothetical protein